MERSTPWLRLAEFINGHTKAARMLQNIPELGVGVGLLVSGSVSLPLA